jgi:CRISPR-associated protein Cmr5
MTMPVVTQSRQRTLEQERAAQAWKDVRSMIGQDKAKEYSQLSKGAPVDIQTFGLGQTLAFWKAKKENHHTNLFNHVSSWVLCQMKVTGATNLLEWLMAKGTTTEDYRLATAETIAFLNWVKRFAEAEIG